MRHLFTAAVLTCLVFTSYATQRPNILILYADDLGYGDLSCQNPDSKIPTPHLDKLAAEGMRFTDGHSSSGLCTPSRYGLLTGRYHWRKFNDIAREFGSSKFDAARLTLPEMLQASGYRTAAIGKWHLGMGWDAIANDGVATVKALGKNAKTPVAYDWSKPIPDGPTAHGFDTYFGEDVINFPPYTWIENDRVTKAPNLMYDNRELQRAAKLKAGDHSVAGPMVEGWNPYDVLPTVTQKALEFIQQQENAEQPFFLYMAFGAPHNPIVPNDEFDGKSQAGPYGDFVYETDHCIGRILTALDAAGLADNTLVVFTADNGAERYAFARDKAHDHWSSNPFRGVKRDIYEGGHHVPFIVRWPGVTPAGKVSDALVSQVDLMAAFAAMTGFDLPSDQAEDSYNVLPLFKGEETAIRSATVHNTADDQFAMRQGDWVLVNVIDAPRKSDAPSAWAQKHGYASPKSIQGELYNLKTDPGQRHNVSAEHPEKVKTLTALLKKIREQGFSAPRLMK
ncbi:sulfatase-like hydrolase/transferase [Pontiella sulfatireligans]|uniref:Arylsulfatase n=1 Tax=Pontiella sulfatireligans TaxID=2750658 RepID=A0A6C2UGR2_9BACT|nr:sulfatase-like hydrolase/transferase [Pontiella sulfatireligans]SPS74189.1 sulfatase S1_15 [Kiritimatiellales bacterium]VGO18554.1 Arylsulfatase [Pontiella sulfatireligans]